MMYNVQPDWIAVTELIIRSEVVTLITLTDMGSLLQNMSKINV